ncbi:MAG: HIT family protein [Candidatus Heimdallarchaeota archaeon]|nr:HIT family protein [Candidatus Heimdallarchaeota archaeon]
MNDTLKAFKYPETLLKEFNYWVVVLRPNQPTLGSLVLISKEEAERFSDISTNAFVEKKVVIEWIETSLSNLFKYDKINYLMLMMVDKEVHYHVIPRYSNSQTYENMIFVDTGWPGLPDLLHSHELSDEDFQILLSSMKNKLNL